MSNKDLGKIKAIGLKLKPRSKPPHIKAIGIKKGKKDDSFMIMCL